MPRFTAAPLLFALALALAEPAPAPPPPPLYSWSDVAAHAAPDDCLVVIYGDVHNFSDAATRSAQKANRTFFEWHPGGAGVVTRWCGQDATNAFAHAGPPHHRGATAEKGYGGLVVGVLDATSHRARGSGSAAAAAGAAATEGDATTTPASSDGGGGGAASLDWREDIGRQSWFHYHSVAAKYPDEPTARDAEAMRGLAASLALYPCEVCRHALLHGELDAVGPVPTHSRAAVSAWWCELHNLVNADLGKPRHACDLATLDARYLRACSACIAPPPAGADAAGACADTAAGGGDGAAARDKFEEGCSPWYEQWPSECGANDDDDFSAKEMCCACGGGRSGSAAGSRFMGAV